MRLANPWHGKPLTLRKVRRLAVQKFERQKRGQILGRYGPKKVKFHLLPTTIPFQQRFHVNEVSGQDFSAYRKFVRRLYVLYHYHHHHHHHHHLTSTCDLIENSYLKRGPGWGTLFIKIYIFTTSISIANVQLQAPLESHFSFCERKLPLVQTGSSASWPVNSLQRKSNKKCSRKRRTCITPLVNFFAVTTRLRCDNVLTRLFLWRT